jgi:hypothetical protein
MALSELFVFMRNHWEKVAKTATGQIFEQLVDIDIIINDVVFPNYGGDTTVVTRVTGDTETIIKHNKSYRKSIKNVIKHGSFFH